MGFGRKFCRWSAGAALLLGTGLAAAEPSEPLRVIQLGDPEAALRSASLNADGGDPAIEGDIESFGRAVSQAVREQQRSIDALCRSRPQPSGSVAAQWSWEASCRYRRY
jgi:hypothetical protein